MLLKLRGVLAGLNIRIGSKHDISTTMSSDFFEIGNNSSINIRSADISCKESKKYKMKFQIDLSMVNRVPGCPPHLLTSVISLTGLIANQINYDNLLRGRYYD